MPNVYIIVFATCGFFSLSHTSAFRPDTFYFYLVRIARGSRLFHEQRCRRESATTSVCMYVGACEINDIRGNPPVAPFRSPVGKVSGDGCTHTCLRLVSWVTMECPRCIFAAACAYNHHSYDVGLWKSAVWRQTGHYTRLPGIRPTYDMALVFFSFLLASFRGDIHCCIRGGSAASQAKLFHAQQYQQATAVVGLRKI